MYSLRYFTSLFTDETSNYINPFITIYFISGIYLFYSIFTILKENSSEKLNDEDVLQFLRKKCDDNSLIAKVIKIILPDKGDKVTLLSGKWKDLTGSITKYNKDYDDYHIKVYKVDNPNTNIIPKRRIFRSRGSFSLITDS